MTCVDLPYKLAGADGVVEGAAGLDIGRKVAAAVESEEAFQDHFVDGISVVEACTHSHLRVERAEEAGTYVAAALDWN
jgi:DNA-binding protein